LDIRALRYGCLTSAHGSCAFLTNPWIDREKSALRASIRHIYGINTGNRRIVEREIAVAGGFRATNQVSMLYCSLSEMNWNFALRVDPIALTLEMMTTEMPAAIRPYSIAVAPDSSFRNEKNLDI
jgi:hypothetical protein